MNSSTMFGCSRLSRCGIKVNSWVGRCKPRSPTVSVWRFPCHQRCLHSQWPRNTKCLSFPNTLVVNFHTSSPRRAHPLIVLLIIKPLSRVAGAVAGWAMKRWWRNLEPEEKLKIKQHFVRNKIRYGGVLMFLLATGYFIYENNVSVNPYTGRRRFMMYNHTQLSALSKQKFTQIIGLGVSEETLLPDTHPVTRCLLDISDRLLRANIDIKEVYERDWRLYVVNTEGMDVVSFASGEIVFSIGALQTMGNVSHLAHVLAHEMSHIVLEHHAEMASHGFLLSGLMMLPLALVWALIPSDIVAAVSGWIFSKTVDVMVSLPYSREQEKEADSFGLKMMAKACFDVREASVYWDNLARMTEEGGVIESENYNWLRTHPPMDERRVYLDGQMMEAMLLRNMCKCPELPAEDPRMASWKRQKLLADKSVEQNSKKEEEEADAEKTKPTVNTATEDKSGITQGQPQTVQREVVSEKR